MCWDANTSILTFILGTILNVYTFSYFPSKNIKLLCIVWQWILCMQIAEFFIWNAINSNNDNQNKLGTKMALILNILQPVIIYVVCMCFSNDKLSITKKILSSILIIFYMSYMLLKFNENPEYKKLNPSEKCINLNLKWWKDIPSSGLIYCITLFSLILLLFSPFKLAIITVLYIFIALLISKKFYNCGQPSIWCWLVVPMPIIVALIEKYNI